MLVMQYYSELVLPECPSGQGCLCTLAKVQEGPVVSQSERVYSVEVACVGRNITTFPKLPKHTRTVDLSDNQVGTSTTITIDLL